MSAFQFVNAAVHCTIKIRLNSACSQRMLVRDCLPVAKDVAKTKHFSKYICTEWLLSVCKLRGLKHNNGCESSEVFAAAKLPRWCPDTTAKGECKPSR